MEDDHPLKMSNLDIVWVKTHDETVRMLANACHIVDLTSNLISLGIFEVKGCLYFGRGGVMVIHKGLKVVMKAVEVRLQYIHVGFFCCGSGSNHLQHFHLIFSLGTCGGEGDILFIIEILARVPIF